LANKQLTAKVRLDITDAERKLLLLAKLFKNLDRAANRIDKGDRINRQLTTANSKTTAVTSKVREWANAQKQVHSHTKATNNALSSVGSKLNRIASTYLGIMGGRAAITTSDIMTSAQNRLNYLADQYGGGASYTSEAMDKMYASAQKVRMSYTDMMSNVSKSMALAGKAFDDNIDKAIRFQEIMAEAYAIGGASAAEMHSSMYQMIQALGANVLAGDELRSVREGAPLAYKAIEEFAQGVYNCKDSLKDMASDGLISAEIVTAAILNAGNKMDSAFAQTAQTFAQTWNQIKNAAKYAFLPVSNMLRDALNKAIDNGLIQKIESFFGTVSKVLQITFKAIEKGIDWVVDNWSWLSDIMLGVISAIISYYIVMAAVAVASAAVAAIAFIQAHWALLIVVGAIALLIYALLKWQQGTIDTCKVIEYAILALGIFIIAIIAKIMFAGLVAAGVMTAGVAWIVIAVVAAVIAILYLVVRFFEYVTGGVAWIVAVVVNSMQTIYNFGVWLGRSLCAIGTNIGIAFQNVWAGITSSFWNMIANLLDGLAWLEGPINAILKAFDKDPISISGIASNLREKGGTKKEYVSLPEFTGISGFEEGWSSAAFNKGMDWGNGVKDKVNAWGSKFQNGLGMTGGLDDIGNKLGLDFGGLNGGFPSASDPNYALNDIAPDVGDIADGVGSIADSMKLTEEDLEYLRKLAVMEWKKEYTTANITLDVTNNNSINSDLDIFGIATKLSDIMYEEVDSMANGVYVG
jgi:tape measure domain-containing protein